MEIKFILIHEYQHKPRKVKRINTSQHESTRIWHESTRVQHGSTQINTSSTRVNTSLTQVNTNQHECKTSLDHKNRINKAKQNANIIYQWCFLEKYVEDYICQWLTFFSPIYFQLYPKVFLFYEGTYFINHRVIVTCNNLCNRYTHLIKSSILNAMTQS